MEILANKRQVKKDKTSQLLANNKLPAVVFSKKTSLGKAEIETISVDFDTFKKIYAEVGESALIDLKIEEEAKPRHVLVKEVQVNPVSLAPIHVGFYEVDMTQEIEAAVPVKLVGEEESRPIVANEGIAIIVTDEIRVKCLPANLPPEFIVDISKLDQVGDFLTIGDAIKVDPSKVEILDGEEEVVVKIDFAEQLEVAEEEERSVEDVEVSTEKPEEGESEEKEEAASKDEE